MGVGVGVCVGVCGCMHVCIFLCGVHVGVWASEFACGCVHVWACLGWAIMSLTYVLPCLWCSVYTHALVYISTVPSRVTPTILFLPHTAPEVIAYNPITGAADMWYVSLILYIAMVTLPTFY